MGETPSNSERNANDLLQQMFGYVSELCKMTGVPEDKAQDIWSLGEEIDTIIKERDALRKQVAELKAASAASDTPKEASE